MKPFITALLTIAVVCPATAQPTDTVWTLEACIAHATAHNIALKQSAQEVEARQIDLHTARHSWLPSLNASVGQNFDFGRSPSKTGVIVDQNSANTSAQLYLSMPLFDGGQIANTIAARRLDLDAATASLDRAREELSVNVASQFLQVLYNKEILAVAQLQVELTREQTGKTEALVETGKAPASQRYDIHAQLAKDELSLAEARNNVRLALLELAQLLELERLGDDFDVSAPPIDDAVAANLQSLVPPDGIYDRAVTIKPAIRQQEFLLRSQEKMLRVARSGYWPRLSLNASYSNGYYRYSGEGVIANVPFGDQLRQNERKTIGLGLSIPIFNRFETRNSVRSARVAVENRRLAVENSKKALYKEIQQAYYSAAAAQEKYIASGKAVEASRQAYTYAEERYGSGKSTTFEFNEAKTKYAQSLSEQAQAKYNFIFRAKILDFYNGIPIRL